VLPIPDLVKALRLKSSVTRGQLARKIKVTPTVIYNVETGRTRVDLGLFFRLLASCGYSGLEVISRHLFSVQGLESEKPEDVVRSFRNRLSN